MRLLTGSLVGLALASAALAADVTVDGSKRHQTIEGFGTCLISWDGEMTRYYERPETQRAYADDMKLNILRCNLWGDDTIGPKDDPSQISHQDPEFAKGDRRTPVFVNFAKAIRQINPDAKVIGTVWSPPAWMKENNRITDTKSGAIQGNSYQTDKGEITNRVKKEYYPHFAKWVIEMVKHYEAQGVPMYAVSPANEPQFTQTFESCVWTAEDLATITGMLGQELEKAGLGHVKIFAPETMTGFNWETANPLYIRKLKEDPQAWEHLDLFATHGYADGIKGDMSKNSSAQFWSLIEDAGKPYWVTEGGTGDHDWPAPVSEKGVAAAIHNALVAGHASAFVPWQFVEKKKSEHALRTTDEMTKKGQAVKQFSAHIPAGSVRLSAEPAFGSVMTSAYLHEPTGAVTVVLINPQEQDQTVNLTLRDLPSTGPLRLIRTSATEANQSVGTLDLTAGTASLTLPAQSITTLAP